MGDGSILKEAEEVQTRFTRSGSEIMFNDPSDKEAFEEALDGYSGIEFLFNQEDASGKPVTKGRVSLAVDVKFVFDIGKTRRITGQWWDRVRNQTGVDGNTQMMYDWDEGVIRIIEKIGGKFKMPGR